MNSSLEEILNEIKGSRHLKNALIHSSFNEGKEGEDYNELKHLGDAVWNLAVLEMIYKDEKIEVGNADKKKQLLVSEEGQTSIANTLGIGELIKAGRGSQEVKETPSVLANTLEAICAAIFLERGYNIARDYILKWIDFFKMDKA
ncbi:MAG: hypothetical protein LUP94_00370 [Candidatus Methanomethylicus sp.]|nr:hypothetical protein [Candidatus Methanomethylicus sp.]